MFISHVSLTRPRRILKTKPGVSVPVAASGFQRVPNFVPPLCPHASNPWRITKDCEMEAYRETVGGKERWVFCARQHKCQFRGSSFQFCPFNYSTIIILVVIPSFYSPEVRYVQGTG
jgi:hypothetical protein